MDLAFYAAATGAATQQGRMNVIANNFANMQTTGFKGENAVFTDLFYNELNPPARQGTQLTASAGAKIDKTNTNFAEGAWEPSESPYHYAIKGDGFFGLRNPQTGEITYTRDGTFRLSQQRDGRFFLTNDEGKAVIDRNNRPIVVTNENKEEEQPVGVFRFRNRNGMLHAGKNEFIPADKNGPAVPAEGEGLVLQYYLESSNVDFPDEMTKLMESQRAYQLALRMVQTSDEVEGTVNALRQ